MFIHNFSERERYLALATSAIVLIAVVYALIIRPVSARWVNLNNQIRSKINALEKDYRILANEQLLRSEYAKFSKYAKPSKSEEEAVADTLAYIENVSRNDSCFIINIKPIGVTNAGSYKEILIDVTAEANIEQFSKFLYDIENPRDTLINIKRFTINSKSGQTGILKGTFFISKVLCNS